MKKIIALIVITFTIFPSALNVRAAAPNEKPTIISEAAVLMDSKSGALLYGKNADEKMYPASLTKIATAIYAIEKGNLQDQVVVSSKAVQVEGTRVYLEEGEIVTLEHLIQGMLINSGNDAAAAIAIYLDGSIEEFSGKINRFLETKVGVHHTHLANPHGLFAENHYTTARDMAMITNYALKNPAFKKIFGTKELAWDGQTWHTTLVTHHLMLKGELPYEGIIGGKTGFLNESKQTLATAAENNEIGLTAIVLKADYKKDIYHDTKYLLDYGFQNYKTDQLSKDSTFSSNHKDFMLEHDALVTLPLSGFKKEVTAKGKLNILSPNGDVIQSLQLTEKKAEPVGREMKNGEIHMKRDTQNAFLVIAILGLSTLIFAFRKRFLKS